MPTMRSMMLFLTMVEKKSIVPNTVTEPRKAPAMTAENPVRVVASDTPNVPPQNNMTKATPKLAPVSIPNIEGPASGLLNAV